LAGSTSLIGSTWPDHYHLVITLGTELSLSKAIGKINENSSRLIKRNMAFHSTFWQHGFHDHLIRSTEDMRKYIEYVHMNPVEEGLVDRPDEWPWSSVHPDHAGKVSRL
jgi:REP element-mobilizing transposase RayT